MGGGRECLGFLALGLIALLALGAVGGGAAPADFCRTHTQQSHWSFKTLKIFLVSLVYVSVWTLPLVPVAAAAARAPHWEELSVSVVMPAARTGSFLNSF